MMAPMAASVNDSTVKFFSKANCDQWLFVLSQYKQVFKIRAQVTRGSKKSGPQDAIKLDDWYQEELPKILQSRKDKHVRYEELVQITKWKFLRTKNRAGLLDLVRINTELAVKQASTKAFKKCPTNLQGAISALVNLKGIGVATASAILCACFPEVCPFMADECLVSVPGIENTNYSINEFMAFADQIKACCERLQAADPSAKWTPHKVELTLWTHYWIKEMKLNLLDNMPTPEGLEDETEETGSDEVEVKNISKNNGDSHVKSSATSASASASSSETTSATTTTTTTTTTSTRNGDKVLDEDSNISVGVSIASEVEDEDSRSLDEVRKNNGTNSNRMTNKSNSNSNSNSINTNNRNSSNSDKNNSAYNCIEDSKDGMRTDERCIVGRGGDDNCRQQLITNGDNSSNLSYSNLSSDDLNNSTTDNTLDGPTNLSMISTNNNTTATTSSSSSSSSSLSSSASTTTTTTTTMNIPTTTTPNTNNMSNYYNNNTNNTNNTDNNMNMNNMNDSNNIRNNININVNVITSSDVSTTSSCLPPLPLPPHQVAVPVEITEGDGSSSIINGHSVIGNSNGDDCKNIDKIDSEINCNTVCSSVDGLVVSSNSIKRPLEEITSSDGHGLEDNGSLEKKSRID